MKGKTYIPYSGTEPRLAWHWNEGIYTFGNRTDAAGEREAKPWKETNPKVRVSQLIYNWKSSVPHQWYSLKSPDTFVHVKDSGKSSTTLEFLGATQKYIHKICHPNYKLSGADSLKRPKILYGRTQSQSRIITPKPKEPLFTNSPSPRIVKSVSAPDLDRLTDILAMSPVRHRKSNPKTASFSDSCKMTKLSPDLVNDNNEDYKVTLYSLPRALSSVRKMRRTQTGTAMTRKSSVEEFLNRFEKPLQTSIEPQKVKAGMDGWKLAKHSSTRKLRTRKAAHTPKLKAPPMEFAELFEGKNPEVYLDYLQFKKAWVEECSRRGSIAK